MSNINKNNWDLESLLNNKSVDSLFDEWVELNKELITLKDDCFSTIEKFSNFLDKEDELGKVSNRLMNYVSNHNNEDLTDEKWISLEQKIAFEKNKFHIAFGGFVNEILKNEEAIKKYIASDKLSEHKRGYDLIFRTKPHILNEVENKIISKASRAFGGVSDMFSILTDSDIRFEDAVSSKGKKVKMPTKADVMLCLRSNDRKVRETAWTNFNKAYYNFENTLAASLYHNYLSLNTFSKLHNYDDYVAAAAFDDEIDKSLILNIYKNVEQFKNLSLKFGKVLKKHLLKKLKLEKLEPWDYSVTLSTSNKTYTIEETKGICLEALKPLGDEYISIVQKAFDEQWISWMPQKGKYSGAYSIGGTRGLDKYYILMNFDKTLVSVNTIIHELGHSMNSYYINKKQKVYADVSIFCAEVASICNETLLALHLLKKYQNDKNIRKEILVNTIREFFSTTTRQIIFSNFEYEAVECINKGAPLTKESIIEIYKSMIEKYEGKKIKKKGKPYEYSYSTIMRIPHFYSGNFYVYKYAIGQIVGLYVASKIFNGDEEMKKKYFDFLSSGESLSPHDTIKLLGIDLNGEEVYKVASKQIDEWIKEFELTL